MDHQRVFTGEVKEIELSAPIKQNWIMESPPITDGYHIWDGHKWFTRDAYPYPPAPPPSVVMTPLQFLRLLTLDERTLLRTAAQTHPIIEDALFLFQTTKDIDLYDSDTQSLLDYLVQQALLSETRKQEIYATAGHTT